MLAEHAHGTPILSFVPATVTNGPMITLFARIERNLAETVKLINVKQNKLHLFPDSKDKASLVSQHT
jgi:hypothetical protein